MIFDATPEQWRESIIGRWVHITLSSGTQVHGQYLGEAPWLRCSMVFDPNGQGERFYVNPSHIAVIHPTALEPPWGAPSPLQETRS